MTLGSVIDFSDILVDEINEDMSMRTEEPTDVEMDAIEKANQFALKRWNIVRCVVCKNNFDMLTCKYSGGSLVCPHCKTIN